MARIGMKSEELSATTSPSSTTLSFPSSSRPSTFNPSFCVLATACSPERRTLQLYIILDTPSTDSAHSFVPQLRSVVL